MDARPLGAVDRGADGGKPALQLGAQLGGLIVDPGSLA